jgi:hypothetical protein
MTRTALRTMAIAAIDADRTSIPRTVRGCVHSAMPLLPNEPPGLFAHAIAASAFQRRPAIFRAVESLAVKFAGPQ